MPAVGPAVVSGVTGFIGGAVARRLSRDGVPVVGLVRPGRAADIPGVRVVEWDTRDADGVKALFAEIRPAVVHHLAAAGVRPGPADVWETVRGNIDLTVALLLAAASAPGCRFVYAGSCFEYGPAPPGRLITEDAPTNPFSPYGAAKLGAAHLVRTLASQFDVPAVVARLFTVYGPGEAPERLVPTLIRTLTARTPVPLTAGEQVRDFLHIDDAVDALLAAGDAVPGEVYNVCSATPVTVRRVGDTLARALGAPPDLLEWGRLPYRPGEPMWIVGDNARFRAAAGWSPRFTPEEGLAAAARSGQPAQAGV